MLNSLGDVKGCIVPQRTVFLKFSHILQPNDVSAALYGGAHAVGVVTGAFDESELLEATNGDTKNVTVLKSLQDKERFLSVCGLASSRQ
jgi:hypothetical protein